MSGGPLIVRASVPSYSPIRPPNWRSRYLRDPARRQALRRSSTPGELPPSAFWATPIQPGSSITGWISVVVPLDAGELVGMERSDLELWPVDENPNYVGIIRFWKNAGAGVVPSSGV